MGAVGSGASNIGGRTDSQSITWEHSGGDGDLGAAVGLGSGVKRWATAEREQVESGARRARSVSPTDAQIEIRWVQRRRRLGSGDDGEGVTKAPQKKRMQTPKKVESGSSANRSNNGPEQSESREQVERETKDRCRERASKIGKPAWPTDGQYKVDEKRGPRSGRAKNVESSVSDDRSSEGVTARVDQGQTEGGTMSRATSAMAKRT